MLHVFYVLAVCLSVVTGNSCSSEVWSTSTVVTEPIRVTCVGCELTAIIAPRLDTNTATASLLFVYESGDEECTLCERVNSSTTDDNSSSLVLELNTTDRCGRNTPAPIETQTETSVSASSALTTGVGASLLVASALVGRDTTTLALVVAAAGVFPNRVSAALPTQMHAELIFYLPAADVDKHEVRCQQEDEGVWLCEMVRTVTNAPTTESPVMSSPTTQAPSKASPWKALVDDLVEILNTALLSVHPVLGSFPRLSAPETPEQILEALDSMLRAAKDASDWFGRRLLTEPASCDSNVTDWIESQDLELDSSRLRGWLRRLLPQEVPSSPAARPLQEWLNSSTSTLPTAAVLEDLTSVVRNLIELDPVLSCTPTENWWVREPEEWFPAFAHHVAVMEKLATASIDDDAYLLAWQAATDDTPLTAEASLVGSLLSRRNFWERVGSLYTSVREGVGGAENAWEQLVDDGDFQMAIALHIGWTLLTVDLPPPLTELGRELLSYLAERKVSFNPGVDWPDWWYFGYWAWELATTSLSSNSAHDAAHLLTPSMTNLMLRIRRRADSVAGPTGAAFWALYIPTMNQWAHFRDWLPYYGRPESLPGDKEPLLWHPTAQWRMAEWSLREMRDMHICAVVTCEYSNTNIASMQGERATLDCSRNADCILNDHCENFAYNRSIFVFWGPASFTQVIYKQVPDKTITTCGTENIARQKEMFEADASLCPAVYTYSFEDGCVAAGELHATTFRQGVLGDL